MDTPEKDPHPKGRAAVFHAIGADKFVDRCKHLQRGIEAYRKLRIALGEKGLHADDAIRIQAACQAVTEWEAEELLLPRVQLDRL